MKDEGAAPTNLPIFPNIIPSKIERSQFHMIGENDIADEQDVEQLSHLMFDYPEREFYYFHAQAKPIAGEIAKARDRDQLSLNETEHYYYPRPGAHDYVKIAPRQTYPFEWQRTVVEKGPMAGTGRLQ